MQTKQYYVYILTNNGHDVFYTGVTSNLEKRIFEHSNSVVDGFTKQYNTKQLMYYEIHNDIEQAILREKKIKKWKQGWKWDLIDKVNPLRENLYKDGNITPVVFE
jgi:putative endonuclease